MTYFLETKELLQLFEGLWDEQTDGPIHMPGTDFEPPDPKDGLAWSRPRVQPGAGFNASSGPSPTMRYAGNLEIQIFTVMGLGPGQALTLVDALVDGLSNQRLTPSNVLTRVASARDAGDDGTWAQVNISVPFQRDRASP